MPAMRVCFLVLVVVVLCAGGGAAQKPNTSFNFSLFDIPGAENTWPESGNNDHGDVAGDITFNSGSEQRGFLRDADGSFLLFEYPGTVGVGSASGLNNQGVIVGFYYDGPTGPFGTPAHGFVRLPDGSFSLFDYPGAVSTFAASINDKGQIAGTFQDSTGAFHGFVRHADLSFELIDHPSSSSTQVTDINNRGEVVGAWSDDGNQRGFLRRRNGIFELIELDATTSTRPRDINDRGDIVASTGFGAFLRHQNGTWVNIEYPSNCTNCTTPTGINRDRQIVGYYQAQRIHGFIAQPDSRKR